MGANLKGSGGIKGLMLRHGEKLAIALIGALSLLFIYKSLGLPKLEARYRAEELHKQITATTAAVDNFTWDTATKEHADKVRIFNPLAKSASRKVNAKQYALDQPLDPAVIAASALRIDPVLLNAVDVRATGGSGLFAFTDEETRRKQDLKLKTEAAELQKEQERLQEQQQQEAERATQRGNRRSNREPEAISAEVDPRYPNRRLVQVATENQATGISLQGGERIERAYWATVVAKVPIREQWKLYQDAFENARGHESSRDFPNYVGYQVQRSEVVRGKPLEWKTVPLQDGQRAHKPIYPAVTIDSVPRLIAAMKEWVGVPMDPVDTRYLDGILTLPLPPLVGRNWGAEATHPDIPLAEFAPPMIDELAELPQEEDLAAGEGDELIIRGTDPTTGAPLSPGVGSYPSPRGGGIREFSGGIGGGEYPGGGGSLSRSMGGPSGGGGFALTSSRTSLPTGVDYLLLRFFDYTVEPGKKYKYRVRLLLADPNSGISPTMLDPSVQDRLAKEAQAARAANRPKSFFRAVDDWSDPSPTVGIPLTGDVRVAEAKLPAEKLYNDEPTVTLWAETYDIDAQQEIPVHVAKEKVLRRGGVANLHEKMYYTGDNDRWKDTYDSYKLDTGYTVLDIEGADRLGKDLTAPARVLMMNPAGEITIRSELDDSTVVANLKLVFTDDKRRRGADGQMPAGGEFFGGRPPGRGP